MKAGNLDEAERLYELARRTTRSTPSGSPAWRGSTSASKDNAKFLGDLAMLADNDADDLDVRKALAERHLEAGQPEQAEKWATECLYIDVYDPACHVLLADALAARQDVRPRDRGIPGGTRPQGQEAQRPQGPAGEGPARPGPARRRQGDPRRRAQGRPRASRGQGAPR